MTHFLELRTKWLLEMPFPRSNTILVNGIPEDYRSNKRLQKFFEDTLDKKGGLISEVVCVKKDFKLMKLVAHKEYLHEELSRHQKQDQDAETSAFCGGRKKH